MNSLHYQILGIIAHGTYTASYIAAWNICDTLGIDHTRLMGDPSNAFDQALLDLIAAGLVEEVPDLSYRYRLART